MPLSATPPVSSRTGGFDMSIGLHNNDFLFDLFHLPGVVTLTLFDDMTTYFWNPEKPLTDERYIDYLIAAQRAGIFPDLDRRAVLASATHPDPLGMRPAMTEG